MALKLEQGHRELQLTYRTEAKLNFHGTAGRISRRLDFRNSISLSASFENLSRDNKTDTTILAMGFAMSRLLRLLLQRNATRY